MQINNKFDIGDTVYLKTDPEQLPRIVTAIEITPNEITYRLMQGENNSYHYGFEITAQKSYSLN